MTRVTITISVPCQECGGVARQPMTVEQALEHADGVRAAAEGLRPIELPLEVRGEG